MRRQVQAVFPQSSVHVASSRSLTWTLRRVGLSLAVLAFWPVCAGAVAAKPASEAKPQRIVSLNLCVDQILVDLVARQRIRALSHLAADASVSAVAKKARGIATTRGEPEQVVQFDPDLVIAGAFTTKATTSLLTRLGLRVLVMPLAQDFAGIRKAVAPNDPPIAMYEVSLVPLSTQW